MVHTLPEYAKTYDGSDKERAIIELFPEHSDILGVIPLKTAPGGRYGYMREGALPNNMGFRGINEVPQEGHGLINDFTEQCFPIAGNVDVDRVLISRYGQERRSMEENMSIKKKAQIWTDTFMNGDNASEPREFTGIKNRLKAVGGSVDGTNYESRLIANSTDSGGGPLSLSMLDLAISLVENPTHILLPKKLKHRLPAAVRDAGVGGLYTNDKNDMGHRVEMYDGLPILTGYGITPLGAFLPFDEVANGGGAAETASAYILSFSEMGVCGIETQGMEVKDIGLMEDGVWYRTNIEHDTGICIESPYAAIRLSSITDAAIVA